MENNARIEKDNKKALKKFIPMVIGWGILGGVFGYFTSNMSDSTRLSIGNFVDVFLKTTSPYAIAVISVALLSMALWNYCKSKKIYKENSENEEAIEEVERHLSRGIIIKR